MIFMTDWGMASCGQDLPVELRSMPPAVPRVERKTVRIVSGLTVTEPEDEVINRDLVDRQLLIPASTRAVMLQGFGTH